MMDQMTACLTKGHLCEDLCQVGAANQTSFPDLHNDLALFSTCYQADSDAIPYYQNKGVLLPSSLTKARSKRQAEYLAGRYCAMEGLRALGSSKYLVPTNKDRSPCWPDGYIGSITHSNGLALAAVGKSQQFRAIGVDAEEIVPKERADRLSKAVLLPDDLKLQGSMGLPLDWFFTLVFSAKESLFKLLYPEVGHFFGFDSAVMKELDTANQTFTVMLTEDLAAGLSVGSQYFGQYMVVGEYLITLMLIDKKVE